jgi:hypothetical protein
MNDQTETNLLLVAAEPTQTRREHLNEAMAQFALAAGTYTTLGMLAEERRESARCAARRRRSQRYPRRAFDLY